MNIQSFLCHNNLYKYWVPTLQRICNPLQPGGFSASTIYGYLCKIEQYILLFWLCDLLVSCCILSDYYVLTSNDIYVTISQKEMIAWKNP